MNNPLLQVENLSKSYQDGRLYVEVLKNLNLSITQNESVAIVGASGSGKSTLLHLLGGLDKPSGGKVLIKGQDLQNLNQSRLSALRNQCLGFVYQFHHLLPEFTALENVMMPLLIGKESKAFAIDRATEMLTKVGLAERVQHRPSELSGGERQRAAIARALVTRPDCVLADEPTGNLDRNNARNVLDLMLALKNEHNTSLIVVTHDDELAQKFDRQLLMTEDGLSLL